MESNARWPHLVGSDGQVGEVVLNLGQSNIDVELRRRVAPGPTVYMGQVDRASQAQGVNSNDCYVRRPAGIQVRQRKAARETPRHSRLLLSDLA